MLNVASSSVYPSGGARDEIDAYDASRARTVLDDHGRAEPLAQRLRHETGDEVRRAPGAWATTIRIVCVGQMTFVADTRCGKPAKARATGTRSRKARRAKLNRASSLRITEQRMRRSDDQAVSGESLTHAASNV